MVRPMRGLIQAFTPPEWSGWGLKARISYVALLTLFMTLLGLGARALAHGLLAA